ncbi:hypothetical protein Dimus_025658 [Dionaea muscipula]
MRLLLLVHLLLVILNIEFGDYVACSGRDIYRPTSNKYWQAVSSSSSSKEEEEAAAAADDGNTRIMISNTTTTTGLARARARVPNANIGGSSSTAFSYDNKRIIPTGPNPLHN